MNFEQITTATVDGMLTITLNRPDRLNAWTPTMGHALIEAFDRADANDAVRVIIVTGAGRGFCAGADLGGGGGDLRPRRTGGRGAPSRRWRAVHPAGVRVDKPVIAAINGPAVGVGATMTLPMDIRLAADTARLGSCSLGAGSCRRRARAGSCRAWSASAGRWSGWPRDACSQPRKGWRPA